MDHRSLIDNKSAFPDGFNGCGKFIAPNACQEAQSAKVDSHDGNILVTDKCYGVKQRTIATQADDKIYFVGEMFRKEEGGDRAGQ